MKRDFTLFFISASFTYDEIAHIYYRKYNNRMQVCQIKAKQ